MNWSIILPHGATLELSMGRITIRQPDGSSAIYSWRRVGPLSLHLGPVTTKGRLLEVRA